MAEDPKKKGQAPKKKAKDTFEEDNIFQAPVITRDPMSRQAKLGSRVVIRVTATGKPLPSYQWFHNGKKIVGANSDRLSLPKVRRQAIGAYHCEAKNFVGKAVSRAAMLTFFTAKVPKLVIGPENTKIEDGKPFTLSVTSPPLAELKDFKIYWMFNGMRIKGAVGPYLNISAVKKKYEGEYKAMIATGSSIETSNVAKLTIKAVKAAAPAPEPEAPAEPPAAVIEPPAKPAQSWDEFNFNPDEETDEAGAAITAIPDVPTADRTPLTQLDTKDLIRAIAAEGGSTSLIEEVTTEDPSALIEASQERAPSPEHDDPSALLELLAAPEPVAEAEPAPIPMPPAPPPLPKRVNPALEKKKAFLERMLQHWGRAPAKRAA